MISQVHYVMLKKAVIPHWAGRTPYNSVSLPWLVGGGHQLVPNPITRCLINLFPLEQSVMSTFAEEVVGLLVQADCRTAFGISGGSIHPFWEHLDKSCIDVYHCRHETGAAFAAMGNSLHTEKISTTFAVSGPGISNASTGLKSAKADGARVVFLSSITANDTSDPRRLQETLPEDVMALTGDRSDQALSQSIIVRRRQDLIHLWEQLERLRISPTGGTLGVFMTIDLQNAFVAPVRPEEVRFCVRSVEVNDSKLDASAAAGYLKDRLESGKFIFWIGHGAQHAAAQLLCLAERYNTPVVTTPRAKGVIPEDHPQHWGVTGCGSVAEDKIFSDFQEGVIILGTSLVDMSTFGVHTQWKSKEIVCVDLAPNSVHRNLPPHAIVLEADITEVAQLLMDSWHSKPGMVSRHDSHEDKMPIGIPIMETKLAGTIHPQTVMSVVQSIGINQNDAVIVTDNGNSMSWTAKLLKFQRPRRYHASLSVASMGSGACSAVGIAASGQATICIVGDGSMLMNNEVSTAVHHKLPVIWIVMNDALYNMCEQVAFLSGHDAPDCGIPQVDFALYGTALGSASSVVRNHSELEGALGKALERRMPTIIDARIDSNAVPPPSEGRARLLKKK